MPRTGRAKLPSVAGEQAVQVARYDDAEWHPEAPPRLEVPIMNVPDVYRIQAIILLSLESVVLMAVWPRLLRHA